MIGFRICFEISAVFVCALCLLYMRFHVKHISGQDRIYKLLLWALILASFCNVLCNVIEEIGLESLYIFQTPLQTLYFVAHNIEAPFFLVYIMELNGSINQKNRKIMLLIALIPFLLAEMICLSNPFTHLVFSYENGIYTKHMFANFMFFISVVYVSLAMIVFVEYRKALSVHVVRRIGAVSALVILSVVLQTVVDKLNTEMFAESLLALMILITLIIGGRDKDPVTGLSARMGILGEMRRRDVAKMTYDIAIIKLHNLKEYQNSMPIKDWNDFLMEFADWLSSVGEKVTGEKGLAMRYGVEEFVIFYHRMEESERIRITEAIKAGLSDNWYSGDTELHLEGEIYYAGVPEEISSLSDIDLIMNLPRTIEPVTVHEIGGFTFLQRNKMLQEMIDQAIQADRVVVYYQPIVDPITGRTVTAEALVRIQGEDGGLIPPGMFIPVAEQSGQIVEIGDRVVRKVCEFIGRNSLSELGISYIEYNLSAKQLPYKDLVPNMMKYMKENGVESSMLNVEITESAEADNVILDAVLERITALGMTFSLDDFGTGYSNFNRLLEQSFENIKIDKSLLDRAGESDKNRELYENLVRMVREMGFRIIQEGVETKEQMEYVRTLGCSLIQGYYYSKPLPEKEFLEYVKKGEEYDKN